MNVSRLVVMQIQGWYHMDHWVLSYRLEYSQDCATFNNVLDVNGFNMVKHVSNLFMYNCCFRWKTWQYFLVLKRLNICGPNQCHKMKNILLTNIFVLVLVGHQRRMMNALN